MRFVAIILLLLAAACAERWARPGATEAEAEAMNDACADQAMLALPPVMVWQVVEPPRVVRDRSCWGERGQERCRYFDRYVPARWGHVDINTQPREAWRTTCMREKGFVFQGYRPLRLE
jgi:hypothetical protein